MSFYVKFSTYLVAIYVGFKLRTYLSNKLRSTQDNDQTNDTQIVLFFPETQIQIIDCHQHNCDVLISANPSSVLCQLLSALKSSRRSLEICMFSLSFQPIIQLIQELSQNGIRVRIIVNTQNKCESVVSKELPLMRAQFEPLVELFRFGVELKFMCLSGDGLMHNKFAIIDNKLLINGSLNWTESSIFNSYDDCILTTDSKLVLTYLKHFNDFWSFNSF